MCDRYKTLDWCNNRPHTEKVYFFYFVGRNWLGLNLTTTPDCERAFQKEHQLYLVKCFHICISHSWLCSSLRRTNYTQPYPETKQHPFLRDRKVLYKDTTIPCTSNNQSTWQSESNPPSCYFASHITLHRIGRLYLWNCIRSIHTKSVICKNMDLQGGLR